MYTILNDPNLHDVQQFHRLLDDQEISREFPYFESVTVQDAFIHIVHWMKAIEERSIEFLRLIKLSPLNIGETEIWDESNSQLVGFIANVKNVSYYSGCENTLIYGIARKWRGKGIMKWALKKTVHYMEERGYNYASAYVKHTNIASIHVLERNNFHKASENAMGITYLRYINT